MTKGNKIFALILALQLIFPLVLCAKGINNEIHFDERAKEIKVKVSSVSFIIGTPQDEVYVFVKDNTYDTDEYIEGGYFSFEETNEGYCNVVHTRHKPKTNVFIADKVGGYGLYWYHKIKTDKISFIADLVNGENEYWLSSVDIYSDEVVETTDYDEYEYCDSVTITEPPTEAYAIFKVYNGKYEIKEVYIDGLQIDEFIENLANGTPDRQKDLEGLEKKLYKLKEKNNDLYGSDFIDEDLKAVISSVMGENYSDEDYEKIMEYAEFVIENGEDIDPEELMSVLNEENATR